MWLSILLSFLVLFVIWVDTNNEKTEDPYNLTVWTRDPKFDLKIKPKANFRSGRPKRPTFAFRRDSDDKTWIAEEKPSGRRIRQPLKERIHERVHDSGKGKFHRARKNDGKNEKDDEHDDDAHVKSTRLTPMQLVDQTSTPAAKKDKGKKESKETDKKGKNKHKHQDKPVEEDIPLEENAEESLEKLSVYSMKHNMEEIAKDLQKETNITIDVLGRTFEYNDIVILKMTEMKSEVSRFFRSNDNAKYIDDVPEKKIIFIVHGIVTMGIRSVSCLSQQKQFVQLLNYYRDHLDKFDIFLIPMANPDGYTRTYDINTWNKNVSPQTSCQGVNLDRNFDVAWSEAGQVSPCSQHYPGPSPFSEPETKAVREVLHRYSHKIAAYIHVHAGTFSHTTFKGEAVLYPKGFSELQSDDDKYMDMKGEIEEVMRNASFQRTMVTIESLHHWYGKVTGTSVDYAATVFGIPFAMEFVMQSYADEMFQSAALTAIWKRIIDAVFNFVHKKSESTNDV